MCMLTFLPPSILPNTERLRQGTVSNRDGHGWAIVVLGDDDTPAHILTGHSMNASAAIDAFQRTREKHLEGPALFHSRFTTGGVVDESNCHPYRVMKDSQTILAHNGVLGEVNVPHEDTRSDTRFFAEEFGDLLYPGSFPGQDFNLNSKRGRKRLRNWLGNPNKFVILTVDPIFRKNFYILNSEQGVWEDDGCWYSNTGYKVRTYGIGTTYGGYGGYSPGYWWDDADGFTPSGRRKGSSDVWTRLATATGHRPMIDKNDRPDDTGGPNCEVCGTKNSVVLQFGYCAACGTCLDCGGDTMDEYAEDACECFWPTGTHPGRRMNIETAFRIREELDDLDTRIARMAALVEESGSDSGTGWPEVTEIGYPPALPAITATAHSQEAGQGADQ